MFSEKKVQRNEARKLQDFPRHELDAFLCRFFAEIRKTDGHKYETESVAVMQSSWTVILKTVTEITVFCEIVNLQIH